VGDRLVEGEDADGIDRLEGSGLGGIGGRQQELARPQRACQIGEGERATHRPQSAVEAQLAAEDAVRHGRGRQVVVGDEQGEGDRQVEVVALLAQVGGGEVDHHRTWRQVVATVADGAAHALAALAHGRVGEADELQLRQAEAGVDLHLDRQRVHPPGGAREHAGEHHRLQTQGTAGSLHGRAGARGA
jgi:hypothetical protein